jgi:hypothetical protein
VRAKGEPRKRRGKATTNIVTFPRTPASEKRSGGVHKGMSKAELDAARAAAAAEKKLAENNSEKPSAEEEGECWRDRDGFWNDGGEPVGGWKRGDVHVLPTGDGTWAAQFCTKAKTKTNDTQWNAFGGFATAAAARAAAEAEKNQTKNNTKKPPEPAPSKKRPRSRSPVLGDVEIQAMATTGKVKLDDSAAAWFQVQMFEPLPGKRGRWQDRLENRYKTLAEAEAAAEIMRMQPRPEPGFVYTGTEVDTGTVLSIVSVMTADGGWVSQRFKSHNAALALADRLRALPAAVRLAELVRAEQPSGDAAPSEPIPEPNTTENNSAAQPTLDETLAMLRDSLALGDMDTVRGVLVAWERAHIVRIVDGKNVQHWLGDRWAAHLSYHTEREAIMEAIEVAQIVYERKGE